MKRIVLTIGLSVLASVALMAQTSGGASTADQIMDKVKDQNRHDSTQARIAATIQEKGGRVSERLIDQYGITENGLTKTVAVFQQPSSVQGTRFLMIENEGRDDDRWIYLPALKKVRRIAASEGGSSFIGEITYDDMDMVFQERVNTLLQETVLAGEEVYLVESTPINASRSTYSRIVFAVSKTKWLPVEVKMFDKHGALLKVMDTLEFKEIQGKWSAMKLRMTNVQNGNTTTMTFQILEYGKPIPASVFTTKFLETGRP